GRLAPVGGVLLLLGAAPAVTVMMPAVLLLLRPGRALGATDRESPLAERRRRLDRQRAPRGAEGRQRHGADLGRPALRIAQLDLARGGRGRGDRRRRELAVLELADGELESHGVARPVDAAFREEVRANDRRAVGRARRNPPRRR